MVAIKTGFSTSGFMYTTNLRKVGGSDERKAYYEILERTQKLSIDATEWLAWFLDTLHRAITQAQHTLDDVLVKARLWQRWATMLLNERQIKLQPIA